MGSHGDACRQQRVLRVALLLSIAAHAALAQAPTISVSFARQYGSAGASSWKVTNTATPATLSLTLPGVPQGVTYVTTYSVTTGQGSFQIGGELTVTNAASVAIPVGPVVAQIINLATGIPLAGVTVASCGSATFAPGQSQTCSFYLFTSQSALGAFGVVASTSNTATGQGATSAPPTVIQNYGGPTGGGTTASQCAQVYATVAPVGGVVPTLVSGAPPLAGGQRICSAITFSYVYSFAPVTCGTYSIVNTATVVSDSGQTATATANTQATVTCSFLPSPSPSPLPPPLGVPPAVAVAAAGQATSLTYQWSIIMNELSYPTASVSLSPGGVAALQYQLVVTRTAAGGAATVGGTVSVSNRNTVALQLFSVRVTIQGPTTAPTTVGALCPSLVVPALGAIACNFTGNYLEYPSGGTATAVVQATSGTARSAPDPFDFVTGAAANTPSACGVLAVSVASGPTSLVPSVTPALPPSYGVELCDSFDQDYLGLITAPSVCGTYLANLTSTLDPGGSQPLQVDQQLLQVNVVNCAG